MKRRSVLAFLVASLLGLAALPCQAGPINVNQDSFVISNEANGFLITELINAGYGAYSPYQAAVFLLNLPGADAAAPSPFNILDFLNALANAPSGAEIFTHTLAEYVATGYDIWISTDGTVQQFGIVGRAYAGTHPVIQTGNGVLQHVSIVHSTDGQIPLNAAVWQGPLLGMTTTYNAFAVAWAPDPNTASDTPEPASLWLVGAGCLVLLGHALRSRRRNYA